MEGSEEVPKTILCTNQRKEVLVTKKDIRLIVEGSLRVVDDLITLDELNEPVLLYNLKERYSEDKIYVCTVSAVSQCLESLSGCHKPSLFLLP